MVSTRPNAAEVEVGEAAESQTTSFVMLSLPPVQLNREGAPLKFKAVVLIVPPLRLTLVPGVL